MNQRIIRIARIIKVLLLLYFFLVSIKLMGDCFKLFGAGFTEKLIASCSNPITGLFIGVFVTSVLQSSSTTTSLVVGLVGSNMIPISFAIPMIMGANIGTTITSTLVSLAFVTRKEDFRRAFSGAVVHDFFNLFTVIAFFPLEMKFHFIEKSAFFLTRIFEGAGGAKFTSPLKVIIDPAIKCVEHFIVEVLSFPNIIAGIIMFIAAMAVLIASLIYIVKTMQSLVMNKTEGFIHKYLFRNDLTSILLGICLTATVQSSSVTISLVVPLIAAGIVTLRRCFPYILGANLGTTCTALLASLATVSAAGGSISTIGVTAAFSHLMFNICGIALFYPLKHIPILCAKGLANIAYKSKKWAFLYVLFIFFVLPLLVLWLAK